MEDLYCGYCVYTATYSGYAGHVTGGRRLYVRTCVYYLVYAVWICVRGMGRIRRIMHACMWTWLAANERGEGGKNVDYGKEERGFGYYWLSYA